MVQHDIRAFLLGPQTLKSTSWLLVAMYFLGPLFAEIAKTLQSRSLDFQGIESCMMYFALRNPMKPIMRPWDSQNHWISVGRFAEIRWFCTEKLMVRVVVVKCVCFVLVFFGFGYRDYPLFFSNYSKFLSNIQLFSDNFFGDALPVTTQTIAFLVRNPISTIQESTCHDCILGGFLVKSVIKKTHLKCTKDDECELFVAT